MRTCDLRVQSTKIRGCAYYSDDEIRVTRTVRCPSRTRDTEDWSNDAENSALITALITAINYVLTHTRIENSYFLIPIFHYFFVFTVFKNKIKNTALVNRKVSFFILKSYRPQALKQKYIIFYNIVT